MDSEVISAAYSTASFTLLLKFDTSQEIAREVELTEYKAQAASCNSHLKDVPITKTISLARLPPWTDPDSLKNLFHSISGGSAVKFVRCFKKKPLLAATTENNSDDSIWPRPDRLGYTIRGFKQAHVVFEKTAGVKNVINELSSNPSRVWFLSTNERPVVNIGLRKWKHEYNISVIANEDQKQRLHDAIEEYVREHDRLKGEVKEKAKALAEQQEAGDDEGWTTVSRHTSKNGKPVGSSSAAGQARIKAKNAKRLKKKELLNFYKFQTREKKLDRLKELKQRFEGDKLKQAKMKQDRQDRKFKPT